MNSRWIVWVVLLVAAVGGAWWSLRPAEPEAPVAPSSPEAPVRAARPAAPVARAPERRRGPEGPGEPHADPSPRPSPAPPSAGGAAEPRAIENAVVELSQLRDALRSCDLSSLTTADQERFAEANDTFAHEADAFLALGPEEQSRSIDLIRDHIDQMAAHRESAGCELP